ncbi:hypothetical protein J6590_062562 [Homalodisca vitripennis]|nr:hypothetical protein J6590_062562 [Homalodisca vitripennis]
MKQFMDILPHRCGTHARPQRAISGRNVSVLGGLRAKYAVQCMGRLQSSAISGRNVPVCGGPRAKYAVQCMGRLQSSAISGRTCQFVEVPVLSTP